MIQPKDLKLHSWYMVEEIFYKGDKPYTIKGPAYVEVIGEKIIRYSRLPRPGLTHLEDFDSIEEFCGKVLYRAIPSWEMA